MRYAVIKNNTVDNIIEADSYFAASVGAVPCETGKIGDAYIGGTFTTPEPAPPDPSQIIADVTAATQKRLDDFAQTRNYDGILSTCTYATSGVPQFAAEGQYAVNARDMTWATLYTVMAEVMAGTRPMPSGFADVEPLLPTLAWPA